MDKEKLSICVIPDGAMVGKTVNAIAMKQIMDNATVQVIDTNPNQKPLDEIVRESNIKSIKIMKVPQLIEPAKIKSGKENRRERRKKERKNK